MLKSEVFLEPLNGAYLCQTSFIWRFCRASYSQPDFYTHVFQTPYVFQCMSNTQQVSQFPSVFPSLASRHSQSAWHGTSRPYEGP